MSPSPRGTTEDPVMIHRQNFILETLDYPLHYLHQSDWNHPSLKGSYVMACVLYSTLFLESTKNYPFSTEIDGAEALFFQEEAATIVLENRTLWNIDWE